MRTNIYLQSQHSLVLDGVPLNGFGDGDYLTIDPMGNAAEITEGGDGPSMNISVPQGGLISFNLVPTSPVIGVVYALRKAQIQNPRLVTLLLFSGTLEVVTASGCAFAKLPSFQSGGPVQQARQFDIKCLEINFDESAVETILGGFVGGLIP